MVDLVEDHETVGDDAPQGLCRGTGRHLLVGGDEPVYVAGKGLAGGPVDVEFEADPVCGAGPLQLEVAGRGDDDEPALMGAQGGHGTGQGEGRLPGARRGDGEEVW